MKRESKQNGFIEEIKESFSKKSRAMAIMYIVLTLMVSACLLYTSRCV